MPSAGCYISLMHPHARINQDTCIIQFNMKAGSPDFTSPSEYGYIQVGSPFFICCFYFIIRVVLYVGFNWGERKGAALWWGIFGGLSVGFGGRGRYSGITRWDSASWRVIRRSFGGIRRPGKLFGDPSREFDES